jgi:succinate dehydrogenase/fumarate reductase flavoprotein subunit
MSLARRVLLGSNPNGSPRRHRLLIPPLLFLTAFAAYALGIFEVAGGVVFLAGEAAVVGLLAAGVLAYRRAGMALAWAAVYGALLGHNADHYLLGLSGRPLSERVAAFLGPDGLAFVGVQALALGTLAWVAGTVAVRAVEEVRARRREAHAE